MTQQPSATHTMGDLQHFIAARPSIAAERRPNSGAWAKLGAKLLRREQLKLGPFSPTDQFCNQVQKGANTRTVVQKHSGPLAATGAYRARALVDRSICAPSQRSRRQAWPHLFRDCAVTGLVDMAPGEIGVAADPLGHCKLQTTEKHYIQAQGMIAHDPVQQMIAKRRSEA